jgi:hypothetical protein
LGEYLRFCTGCANGRNRREGFLPWSIAYVQDALLRVKGLVSFTFNTREEYVVVHALDTVAPAEFAAVIAATGTLKACYAVLPARAAQYSLRRGGECPQSFVFLRLLHTSIELRVWLFWAGYSSPGSSSYSCMCSNPFGWGTWLSAQAQQVVKDDDGADVFVDLNDDKEADAKKTGVGGGHDGGTFPFFFLFCVITT